MDNMEKFVGAHIALLEAAQIIDELSADDASVRDGCIDAVSDARVRFIELEIEESDYRGYHQEDVLQEAYTQEFTRQTGPEFLVKKLLAEAGHKEKTP